METCSKVRKITSKNIGIVAKAKCCNEVYKNGMCKDHYKKWKKKTTNWGERANYIEPTIEEMKSGRSLKLKSEHVHVLYR